MRKTRALPALFPVRDPSMHEHLRFLGPHFTHRLRLYGLMCVCVYTVCREREKTKCRVCVVRCVYGHTYRDILALVYASYIQYILRTFLLATPVADTASERANEKE